MKKNLPGHLVIIFILLLIILSSSFTLFQESIRLDEAQSIWVSTKSVPAILKLIGEDVHVPLYALILHFWIQIFGTDIMWVRALSLIFFLLSLPVLYKLAKEASSVKVALLTVSLFSTSPFIIWYINEARMYTLLILVSLINNFFFLKLFRSRGRNGKLGYFLSIIFGIYTHYFFLSLIFTQILFVFIRFAWKMILSWKWSNLKFPLFHILLVFSALVLLVPWIWYVYSLGFASNTQPIIPRPSSFNLLQTFVVFLFGFQSDFIQGLLISLWPILVIVLFLIFTQKRKITSLNLDYFVVVTFVPIIAIFLFSFVRPIYLTRYLIFVVPVFFYLLAQIIINFPKKVTVYIVSVLVLSTFVLQLHQNVSAQTPIREDYRQVAQYLYKNATDYDVITVTAPFTIYPLEYTYSGKTRIDTIPRWDRFVYGPIPPFNEQDLDQQAKEYEHSYKRLFLVLSYDQGYEEKVQKYFDERYHVDFFREFSPKLELRVYRIRYDI